MTVARAVFWTAMIAWGAIEVSPRPAVCCLGPIPGPRHLRLVARRGARGLATALLLDVLVPAVVHQDAQTPFLAVGATLVIAGVLLRLWAISTLGRFFTYQVAIAPDPRVVTDGPYRWVRHPSYTGLLVSCLGAGVASANVASLVAVLAVPTYGFARRIRVEEQALLDALGELYQRFLATRKRLVPGIW